MTQAERVRQAQAGDVDAFCALYTAYQQKLFHYAYYKLGNVQDVEDVVQDCMLTAFEQLGMLKKPEAFGSWLFSILYHGCAGAIKEQITRRNQSDIAQALPAAGCDYFGDYQGRVPSSPVLFVGFWTDKGTADAATLELLKIVKNKKIFLFGTAGFGGSAAYFQKILLRVQENLDAGNQVIGTFMCQGKMPLSVRQRYEKMKEQPNPAPNLDMLIANFDRALTHPDEQDLQRLQEAVCAVQM